jgi:Ca2+-binding RTX toxin-like protein
MTAGSGGGTYTGATAAVVNTITGGTGNDTIIGGAAADVLSAGAGNDIIRGLAGRDNITTGAGSDSVRYTTAATSAAAAGAQMDIITDFTAGTDKINLLGDAAAGGLLLGVTITAANAAMATMGAVVTSATNVGSLTELYTAIGTSLAALTASAANGQSTVAQVITFSSGSQAGTYLVINDQTAGFQGANDIVINLTGLTGTISAGDFTFLNA